MQDGCGQSVRGTLNKKNAKFRMWLDRHVLFSIPSDNHVQQLSGWTHPLDPGVAQHLAGTQAVFGIPNQKFGN